MHNRRSLRLFSALGLAAMLAAGTLTTTLAANPAGWGATLASAPADVSLGDYEGFVATFTNSGPSNISQLYAMADDATGATFVSATPSQGTCNDFGPLLCNLGAVPAGTIENPTVVTIKAVYLAPSSGQSSSLVVNFNTTGTPNDKKGRSHGDAIPTNVATTDLCQSNRDCAGRWVNSDTLKTVFTDPNFSNRNQHSTQINSPVTGIGVSAQDLPGSAFDCPTQAEGKCFGQWSDLSVNFGQPYPQGFTVLLGLSHFEVPNTINLDNLNFVHLNPDGTFLENITATCEFGNGNDQPPTNMPCKIVSQTTNGDFFGLLWLTKNGPARGW